MHTFRLYGLSEDSQLLSTEQLSAERVEEARRIATDRLLRFPKVELWEGPVCVLRRARAEVGT